MGHRGASHSASENTLESVLLAFERGADGAEFDVQMSADGRPGTFTTVASRVRTCDVVVNGLAPARHHLFRVRATNVVASKQTESDNQNTSEWSEWSDCFAEGPDNTKKSWEQTRSRMIVQPQISGGNPCPPLTQAISCSSTGGLAVAREYSPLD